MTAATDDAVLLEASLEIAAGRCEDLTPLVFARFLELQPDSAGLFTEDDLAVNRRGRMLQEITFLLLHHAAGESYVPVNVQSTASDHTAYGVYDPALYTAFFVAYTDVLAALLGDDWNSAYASAWQRQSEALLSNLPVAALAAAAARHRPG